MEIAQGFRPLFGTSPVLDLIGSLFCRGEGVELIIRLRVDAKHRNARWTSRSIDPPEKEPLPTAVVNGGRPRPRRSCSMGREGALNLCRRAREDARRVGGVVRRYRETTGGGLEEVR